MKIRSKFFLAGFVLVSLFLAGLYILTRLHNRNAESLLQEWKRQNQATFNELISLRSKPLQKTLVDYTYWDEMVSFLHRADPVWARENLDELLLTQGYDALWVYLPDGRLVYSRVRTAAGAVLPGTQALPEKAARLDVQAGARMQNFFLQTPAGLLEVHGATVHPTADVARRTPPQGTLFVGQLWGAGFLNEIGMATRSEVFLTGTTRPPEERRGADEPWQVVFIRRLPDVDGRTLAVLHIRLRAQAIGAVIERSNEYLLITSLFGLSMLGLLLLAVFFWVNRPLRGIIRGLDRHDRGPLLPLAAKANEFGRLSNLIVRFFDQKQELEEQMTARQRIEEQLLLSQKLEAVGRLAGGIAHDFNNLLTVILGYSDMLLVGQDVAGRTAHSGRQIRLAAEQAAALTRQLLAFSRKQLLQSRPLDLHELIRELEAMLRRLIGEDIAMTLHFDAVSPRIVADPAQISQVILNLALNARDAMPNGGRLLIETHNVRLDDDYVRQHPVVNPGDYVQLDISDSGVGMSEETQAHIFEPFFTTKELGKGTGLGLATVYGIVKQSGGYIWVYSELDQGTVFKIFLPLAATEAAVAAPAARPASPVGGHETLLVVEDKPEVLDLIREVLAPAGYTILAANTPAEAMRLCREGSAAAIRLLLTDVVMPGMNGPQLARGVQELFPAVRVLYMSGYTDNAVIMQQILAAGKSLLQKPFTAEELQRRVREALDN